MCMMRASMTVYVPTPVTSPGLQSVEMASEARMEAETTVWPRWCAGVSANAFYARLSAMACSGRLRVARSWYDSYFTLATGQEEPVLPYYNKTPMCRFLIFKGKDPILLSHLLTRPAHSIINQSFDSRLRLDKRRPINGDGFGVGYYSLDPELECGPCVFRAITPAWNNMNLEKLAEKTKSNLVFAHVRASTYGVLSETNCHPFTFNSLMFMHNGGISNFSHVKRKLINHIQDEYFLFLQGSTDSECCFALFLDTLDKMGYDPSGENFGDVVLREALLKTIEYIKDWTKDTPEPSLLNFAVTDGNTVVVSRYITSKEEEAASLHFSCGSSFVEYEPNQYRMERVDRVQNVIMVASEPLTFERGDWIAVPTNTVLTIKNQTVLLHPIRDEYYQEDPLYMRSSQFAESKGLMGSVPVAEAPDVDVPPLEREGRSRIPVS